MKLGGALFGVCGRDEGCGGDRFDREDRFDRYYRGDEKN